MSEQRHVKRLRLQGKKLALANKKCRGKKREKFSSKTGKSEFTTCVIREAKKVFKKK